MVINGSVRRAMFAAVEYPNILGLGARSVDTTVRISPEVIDAN